MKKAVFFIFLMLTSLVSAQRISSSPREALYQALDIYSLGRYDEAYEKFKYLAEFYSIEEHHTIFKFMAAKSLYKGGKLDEARTELNRYIKDYPSSAYICAAYLYLGHIAYRESRLLESSEYYIKAVDFDKSSESAKIAAANLVPLLGTDLSMDDLAFLAENYPRAEYAGEIVYFQGKRHYENGRYKRAVNIFEKYLENYTPGRHTGEVKQLLSTARERAFRKITIGVLAPVTGTYADYGKEMVDGIKIAFANSPKIGGKDIDIQVIDSRGSPVQATKAIKSMALEEPVIVLGPLRSESAVGAAIIANFNNIPMITPTASEKGISELGENIFQVSPPAEDIADKLAEYAINEMGITEFGIIAPGDYTSRQVARAFSQKVYQLGGEVLSTTFYEPGETDFSNQIKPLRQQLLMRTEEQLASELIDSTEYFDEEKEEWLEQEDWRVYLGGLFLPGYADELSLLVPQIRYHVITAQYLGLDGWDSRDLIGEIERYVDGSIFATDYHPGMENRAYDDFYTAFYRAYGKEPGRVAALAYDSAILIRRALENGASTADEVAAFLRTVENYQGASCKISFRTTVNANDAVSIYRISAGSLERLK